jgi:integrase
LERYNTSIATAHRLAVQPDPTRSARARNALHALMAGLRTAQPRAPLRRQALLQVMAGLWPAQSTPSGAGRRLEPPAQGDRAARTGWRGAGLEVVRLWDLRARALLACLYPTMARRSELLALRVEDLPQGVREGVVPIDARKIAQRDSRFVDALALECVVAWCEAAAIRTGPIFRELDPHGGVGERAMSAQQLMQVVRACWAHRARQQDGGDTEATLSLGTVPELGGHSLRIGAAHDMAASGQDLLAIMHAGGWKDARMPRQYIQELKAEDSGMARMLRGSTRRTRGATPKRRSGSANRSTRGTGGGLERRVRKVKRMKAADKPRK